MIGRDRSIERETERGRQNEREREREREGMREKERDEGQALIHMFIEKFANEGLLIEVFQ